MWTKKFVEYLWKTSSIPAAVNATSNVSNISELTSPDMEIFTCIDTTHQNRTTGTESLVKSSKENPYINHEICEVPLGSNINVVDLDDYHNTGNYDLCDDLDDSISDL